MLIFMALIVTRGLCWDSLWPLVISGITPGQGGAAYRKGAANPYTRRPNQNLIKEDRIDLYYTDDVAMATPVLVPRPCPDRTSSHRDQGRMSFIRHVYLHVPGGFIDCE